MRVSFALIAPSSSWVARRISEVTLESSRNLGGPTGDLSLLKRYHGFHCL